MSFEGIPNHLLRIRTNFIDTSPGQKFPLKTNKLCNAANALGPKPWLLARPRAQALGLGSPQNCSKNLFQSETISHLVR